LWETRGWSTTWTRMGDNLTNRRRHSVRTED
jgi:hypothetical protein